MNKSARVVGVDALRLLAALCVVALHVDTSNYPFAGTQFSDFLRLCCRWAVPYFFMVTGYFLERRGTEAAVGPALARTVVVFALANLLFIPFDLIWTGLRATVETLLDPRTPLIGMQVHLWYLSASIIGLLALLTARHYAALRLLGVVAVAALLLVLMTGAYYPPLGFGFVLSRDLLSIPCMLAGMAMAHRAPGRALSWLLIVVGVALQWLEATLLARHWHASMKDYEFLIGTIPLVIGLFGVALQTRGGALLGICARLGARYALGLYVLHPYLLQILQRAAAGQRLQQQPIGLALVIAGFVLTLLLLALIDRLAPWCLDLLAGNVHARHKPPGAAPK